MAKSKSINQNPKGDPPMKIQDPNIRFELVELNKIIPDPNQPRKFFHDIDMKELAESVREKGVLQPILVRIIENPGNYMLVSGERRYRASKMAGLDKIPAVIRNIPEEVALEIQIIENLQRKDVHPLEEAEAYKALANSKSLSEISRQIGKTEKYVTRRMQLCQLSESAKNLFFENKISIETAQALSQVEISLQDEILHDEDPYSELNDYIKECLSDHKHSLAKAIWSLDDIEIYPEAGSCSSCSFNSANQPLLFDDNKVPVCNKPSCFTIKKERSIQIISSSGTILIDTHYNSKSRPGVLTNNEFQYSGLDEEVLSLDDWLSDNGYDNIADAAENDEITEKEVRDNYNEYTKQVQEEIDELNQKLSSGEIVKAFDLHSQNYIHVYPKSKNKIDKTKSNADDQSSLALKENRAKQLDRVKIYLKVKEVVRSEEVLSETSDRLASMMHWLQIEQKSLDPTETVVLYAHMFHELRHNSELKDEIKKVLTKEAHYSKDWTSNKKLIFLLQLKPVQLVLTKYFVSKIAFPDLFEAEENTNIVTYASCYFAREYMPLKVGEIENEINQKTKKREERYKEKIKAMSK